MNPNEDLEEKKLLGSGGYTFATEKIHVLVPKEHWDTLKPLVRKQVRVTIDDEL
jgi:hypothetical protein